MVATGTSTASACISEPPAGGFPACVSDVGELIVAATGERYADFAKGRLLTVAPPGAHVIPAAAFLETGYFSTLIEHGAARFPGETDKRALASYWSLFYLSTIVIGAALSWLTLRRILPFEIAHTGVIIDPVSTAARGFLLPDLGRMEDKGDVDIFAAMTPTIRQHLDPLIAVLAKESGLSRKVFWTNAAAYLAWIVDEVGRQSGEHLGTEGQRLLSSSHWPDGWKNPMHGAIRYALDENGETVGHRRVCCLRYGVPGVGGCGAGCPVPEGRQNSRT